MICPVDLKNLATSPTRRIELTIDQLIPEFESLTAVKGELSVQHRGDFLEVEGHAHTIVTLECDRCLARYNHRLATHFEEVLWLDHDLTVSPPEREIALEDLEEHVSADGQLDLLDLVYQHLSLALPLRRLCTEDCPGLQPEQENAEQYPSLCGATDYRWAALAEFRKDLPQ